MAGQIKEGTRRFSSIVTTEAKNAFDEYREESGLKSVKLLSDAILFYVAVQRGEEIQGYRKKIASYH